MAMTEDAIREINLNVPGLLEEIPVKAATKIYAGAAVGEDASTGYARGLVAGDVFLGMAERQADNTSGAAGDKRVSVRRQVEQQLTITDGVAQADLGAAVYASADGTFTTTAGANTQIGKITRIVSATKAMVFCQAAAIRSI